MNSNQSTPTLTPSTAPVSPVPLQDEHSLATELDALRRENDSLRMQLQVLSESHV